ncbi:MAG TPA: hypothetical protein VMZ28_13720 [Kofleriaceae bacterium]|nr:hypothetical protein [Kofleriaceae bacterium]
MIVDSAKKVHTRPAAGLEACGYSVHVTGDPVHILQRFSPRVLIVDLGSCGQVLVDVQDDPRAHAIRCVAMTDTPDSLFAQSLMLAGMRVMEKPLGLRELLLTVESLDDVQREASRWFEGAGAESPWK